MYYTVMTLSPVPIYIKLTSENAHGAPCTLLTFTAIHYLPPYTSREGPLDPVIFKEATLFICIRVH